MTTNSYGSLKKRPIHPNMSVEEIAYLTTNNIPHKFVEEKLSIKEIDEAYFDKVRKRNLDKELLLVEITKSIRRYNLPKNLLHQVCQQAIQHVLSTNSPTYVNQFQEQIK